MLTYAIRQLRRNPLFALTAVLTIAIGIGANTTVFTVANALLFRDPAGVADPGRLIDIGVSRKGQGFGSGSYANYVDIRKRVTTLSDIYAHPRFPNAMSFEKGRVFATEVSVNYFAVLGAVPAVGRLFDENDAAEKGADAVIVLSHRFWTQRFNADNGIIGQSLRLDGRPYTVVGIAAPAFQGTGVRAPDLWLTLHTDNQRAGAWLLMGGRLKPGVPLAQAAAELDQIGRALQLEYPVENQEMGLKAAALSPIPGESVPVGAFLTLLMAIVMIVLMIACANVSGVLLSRAAVRRREIAIRLAIGAGRPRIIRQLLAESLFLCVISAGAGLALARGMTSILVSQLPNLPFPINVSLALDVRVVLFSIGLSLFAALLSGIAPALHASKSDIVVALKDDSQLAFGRLRLRYAFVVAQVALSVLLVVVGGLFLQTLRRVAVTDPGFDPTGVELASLDLSMAGYTNASGPLFARELIEQIRNLPDVESATIATVIPGGFEGIGLGGLSVPGVDPPAGEPLFSPVWNIVEPGYFNTLRMPLLTGRDFTAADQAATQSVVILGEGAASRFWPGQNPIGRFVQLVNSSQPPKPAKSLLVVGVARDPKFGSLVDGTTGIYAYVPLQQQYFRGMPLNIVARSTRGQRLTTPISEKVASIAPNLPILTTQTAEEYAALGLMPQRIAASAASSLGFVGMVLAGIGVYGVTASIVTRRTREIGVRVALGATRTDIIRMVLKQGMSPIAVGCAAGLIGAAGVTRVLVVFLLGTSTLDPVTYSAAALAFAATGVVACYVPTRRATKIEPMHALRHE
jgi:predicted permease